MSTILPGASHECLRQYSVNVSIPSYSTVSESAVEVLTLLSIIRYCVMSYIRYLL